MFRFSLRAFIVAAFAAMSFAGVGALAAEQTQQRDLGKFQCKEVMILSGQDRDVAVAFAHGYVLGKKGTTKYNVDALAKITDKFIDFCLDNPKANALQAFEKIAK